MTCTWHQMKWHHAPKTNSPPWFLGADLFFGREETRVCFSQIGAQILWVVWTWSNQEATKDILL